MLWIIFALGAALAWGLYGPALHQGQVALGNPMRALLCVGVAYFLIGVLVPLAWLSAQGELHGFTMKGSMAATIGGALGAIGAANFVNQGTSTIRPRKPMMTEGIPVKISTNGRSKALTHLGAISVR